MKKYLLLLLTLVFAMTSYADKVTEQQARQKAQRFFKDKQIVSRSLTRSMTRGDQSASQEDFYVFNAENNGGFVIISGDDRTPEVLGYANSGYLDIDTLPPNIKWWLTGYSKQISSLGSSSNKPKRTITRTTREPIATLMTTKWGQDYPYNMNCPDFLGTDNKCFTGCIATAMAQIMYYHRAKSTNKTITTIPGYNTKSIWFGFEDELITIEAIPEGAIIDWGNMLDEYNGSETAAQKEAVANLMLYCGASVNMDYARAGAGSSAIPSDIPIALIKYFDYSENSTLVWRQNYTEADWDELIYSELSKGNPLYYGGYNSSSGHAFVCDGYDGNGYYHINWGWDGLADGFFLLSALNPSQQGTGGSSAGYNDSQCALIGAVPNGDILRLTSQSVSLTGNTSFILYETGDNITIPVRWGVQNMTGASCNFDHAIGLYHNGELVKVLKETGTSEMFTANQEKEIDASLNIETNLSSGIYQLYALCRSQDEEKWFRNENSSDCYITLVVKDSFMSFYVGKPAAAENIINFADDEVKHICVENWDTDGDGEISYDEAAAVTDFGYVFERSNIKTFDEAQYFTGITSFGLTHVNGAAFEDGYSCSSLVSIKIPSSATSIREGGFYGCKALTSIDIPASVKEIGENAFQACFGLHKVSLHEGLEKLNDGAFYKCGFSSINIPSSVSFIGKTVWGHCPNLIDIYVDDDNPYYNSIDGVLFTKDQNNLVVFPCKREGSYNIPIGTEAINPCAFYSSALEDIVFPESLKSLGDKAFQFMENLKEFTIPNTITTIGEGVFWGCFNLKDVAIEGNRYEIPEGMFYNCSSLNRIHLPEDITSIGAHAFGLNGKLTEITIPSKVTYIGESAFAYTDLRRVRCLMETPCAISSTVFEGTNVNPILYVPEQSIAAYKEADNWKNFSQILPIDQNSVEPYVELNNGVLTFYNDKNRNARSGIIYDIPYASNYTSSLAQWTDNNSTITKIVFDASFADARPTITQAWFDGCEILTEIQGIENLNTSEVVDMFGMFQNCHSLVSLDLSNLKTSKVTSMVAMFAYCKKLKTLILPNDLTFIDSGQFESCYSLTEITIPANVTSIGDKAFSYSGLKKVKSLMQAPCGISSTVFENVSNNATLYVPAGCKAAYEAADYWKDFKKIMGPSSYLIYMVDGEEYCSYEIEHGSAITPEAAPTKEGYTFSGWSDIPETMPANDVTITGTFTINKYKLTYKVDGEDYKSYDVEYGATITPEAEPTKDGYIFSGWSEIPETMPAKDVTITGTFAVIMTPPTGKSGLVYNGTAQDLITAGSSIIGTMQYSLDGTTYAETIPQGTNAGSYTVFYKVKGDANHNDIAAQNFQVSIAAKTVESPIITLSETSYTYDGTAKEPTVAVKDGETTIPATEFSVSYTNNTNAGTATVTITDVEGGNYAVSGSTTFTISAADGSLTAPTGKSDLVYNGSAQNLINAGSSTTGTLEYSLDGTTYAETIPQGTDAGSYTVYYKVTGDANHNDIAAQHFGVKIAKAALTVSVGDYEIYEGEEIPSFEIKYEGFVNNETADALTTKPTISCEATVGSKPDEYKVTVSGAEAKNYEITHVDGKLTILAKSFVSGGDENKDEDDSATYQVNNQGGDGDTPPTVAITDDKDVSGSFAIPESVTYQNKTYTVTEIGEGAFENNKNLTNVSIPSSITNIGDKAFKGCSNLKSITVNITTPISLSAPAATRRMMTRTDGSSVFDGVDMATCILYVPEGSVELYKAASVWCEFQNIMPLSSTGIKDILMPDGEAHDVYNLQGRKVKARATTLEGLPPGVYIINGKKTILK